MSEQLALALIGVIGTALLLVGGVVKLVSKRGSSIPPPAPKALAEPAHAHPPASTRGGDAGDHTRQIRSLMAAKRDAESRLATMQRDLDQVTHAEADLRRQLTALQGRFDQLTDKFHAYQQTTERELGTILGLLKDD